MKIHQLSAEEAFRSVRSGPDGLSEAEALRRLDEFGPNRVERLARTTTPRLLVRQFSHFFALILWLAAALAFVAELRDPGAGMGTLGVAVVGVIVVNGLFSFWQEYRAERAVSALQRLLPDQVQVRRDGIFEQAGASDLVPGDLVLLEEGQAVPADCRLVEAFGVKVNNATITGESVPVPRDTALSTCQDVLESQNIVLAGTHLVTGHALGLVYATGMHTEFGKVAGLAQSVEEPLSPLQQEISRLSRAIALLSLALGVTFFFAGRAVHLPFWANFVFAIGIIVANVPEGLLPTVTLALAMASQRMARRNALVRHLPAIEALGAATVICTDKTGTLTRNEMEVRAAFIAGRAYDDKSLACPDCTAPAHRRFFEAAAFCENVTEARSGGARVLQGDPMEVAIVAFGRKGVPLADAPQRVEELPFDTGRKRLSTLYRSDSGLALYTKGAPEAVLPLCDRALTEEGAAGPFDASRRAEVSRVVDEMTARGLRVLALAWRPVTAPYDPAALERDLILCGLVGLEDPPRPEVPEAVRLCTEAGIRVIMITGDHPHTAEAVARQVGLIAVEDATPPVVTGEHLRRMSDVQLQLALDADDVLFARVTPDQKQRIVRALKRKGHVVAVTGDGVNDAPALREADVGVAMGQRGTDVAREAADLVLLDDNFATIVAAVEEGRAVYANIRKFLSYILSSNVPELVPYLAYVLLRIPLPLTVVQILAVDLGTDILPALALGGERPDPNVMKTGPRHRTERLLTVAVLLRSYLWLGLQEAAAAMAAYFFVLARAGWVYGHERPSGDLAHRQATTACLAAIVVMQAMNVFLCRDERESVFRRGFAGSRLLFLAVAAELALIAVITYTAPGNALFGTAPLPAAVWLFILPFPVIMLASEEARKWFTRWRRLARPKTGGAPASDAGPATVADPLHTP